MDAKLKILKDRLSKDYSEEVLTALQSYVASHPDCDEAYFLLGNAYRRNERWGDAMNAYQQAMDLNPESPAQLAYRSIVEVLDFYNKDMFNQ